MQRQFSKPSEQDSEQPPTSSQHADQYGLQQYDGIGDGRSPSQRDGTSGDDDDQLDYDSDSLEETLRRLNVRGQSPAGRLLPAGQRISDYENAMMLDVSGQASHRAKDDGTPARVTLNDLPNEILTHVFSHLRLDEHDSISLVSKRFYYLITFPHPWRMAFQRFFPGQDALGASHKSHEAVRGDDDDDATRYQVRPFTRLTPAISWRSEYLLRTRLMRCLSRGKPGARSGGGSSLRAIQRGKKPAAVLTYNSWVRADIDYIHADFTPMGKKPPRVVHGASEFGIGTASDPTIGKCEKWGVDDPFLLGRLDLIMPHLIPYGWGDHPTAVPNVMDVGQPYGIIAGEGYPGGRPFFRPNGEPRGRYLTPESSPVIADPDIPKIPEINESVCSVWIAKSSTVPTITHSLVGIMTGSSLGVVTTYAVGPHSSGPRYASGEMTARWVLCAGVPIIAVKVDDNYSQKRRAQNRVFAVALNALGEVYYLTQPPTPPASKSKDDDSVKLAWHTARTTYWHIVEATRRKIRPDVTKGVFSPRTPANAQNLPIERITADARGLERFLRQKPTHFQKVCYGWDMRRKFEVDFAGDDKLGAGEAFFIIECGWDEEKPWSLKRFTRSVSVQPEASAASQEVPVFSSEPGKTQSMFGDAGASSESADSSERKQASSEGKPPRLRPFDEEDGADEWTETVFHAKGMKNVVITYSAIDMSSTAVVTSSEDPLKDDSSSSSSGPSTPAGQVPSDIPGRMARFIGVGTNTGKIVLWNMRAIHTGDGIYPVRVIKTESPEINAIAISALYLVHGGSDGLVQAWDPLASTLEPIRTLVSRYPGIPPSNAIFLDPNPTVLHGIVAFGTTLRYWAYSSSNKSVGRKRRQRHSDVQSRISGRRHGGGVKGFIAAEAEELRDEEEQEAREQARLRARFGVNLDLSEEEALQYAEMMSQETFLLDVQRRVSASDFDTTSTTGSMVTVTPEPSVTEQSQPTRSTSATIDESEYDHQIQAAIRLSLLEGGDDFESSPNGHDSGEYDGPIIYKEKKGKHSASRAASSNHTGSSSSAAAASPQVMDDDLELALKLSLAEEQDRQMVAAALGRDEEEFPPLGSTAPAWKGKGRAI